MLNDLRYAFRQLMKSPGFTLIAALTLALGIGANTAIFSLINILLLKPLPYPDSERIAQVYLDPNLGDSSLGPVSGGIYLDFAGSEQFQTLAAAHSSSLNLTGIDEPKRLRGLDVTSDYLKTLGVRVALGRDFTKEDNLPGGDNKVVLLSDNVWKNQFGADPRILNHTVTLDYEAYTVIGILPPRAFLAPGVDYLVPAAIEVEEWKQLRRYNYVCALIGRLKDGATLQSAQAELESIKNGLNESYPDMMRDWGVAARSLRDSVYGQFQPYAVTLFVAVGLVLLIACANVANLLLARATSRQGEIAVRAALGAPGWKIARQLICESLMLAAVGGLIGLVLGIAALKPLALVVGLDTLPNAELEIDVTVMLFTVVVSLLTGLLFGLFPAFKSIRAGLASGLRDSTRSNTSAGGQRVQSALIVAEVALTVTLLVGIGLLLKSFSNAMDTDPGFRTENVLTFEIARSSVKSPNREDYVRFTEQVLERLESLPGVESAGMVSTTPMNGSNFYGAPIWRDDQPDAANTYFAGFDSVNGDFFRTVGIPLISGRFFDRADQVPDSQKTLIINAQVAKDLFPDSDPLGQIVHHDDEVWEIVGVVGSISPYSLDSGMQPMVYKPQVHWPWNSSYVVRAQLPPLALADQIKAAVLEVDPEQPVDRIRTLEHAVSESLEGRIVMVSLIGLFGIMAAFLAAIGIYGLMSYLIEQRSREFGIRLAVGALPEEIVRLIFKRGLLLAALGLLIGIVAVVALGRLLAFILYQVEPYDPMVLSGVALLTLAITALACWRPAKQASRISPCDALRLD